MIEIPSWQLIKKYDRPGPRYTSYPTAPEWTVERALSIVRAAGKEPGYIFNLGHGIQVGTPPETVKAVVDAVHAFTWK